MNYYYTTFVVYLQKYMYKDTFCVGKQMSQISVNHYRFPLCSFRCFKKQCEFESNWLYWFKMSSLAGFVSSSCVTSLVYNHTSYKVLIKDLMVAWWHYIWWLLFYALMCVLCYSTSLWHLHLCHKTFYRRCQTDIMVIFLVCTIKCYIDKTS